MVNIPRNGVTRISNRNEAPIKVKANEKIATKALSAVFMMFFLFPNAKVSYILPETALECKPGQ